MLLAAARPCRGPVKARASRTAAVVTSEPFLANLTISAAGTSSIIRSASSSSSVAGRVKFEPSASCAPRGLDHARVGVPEHDRAQAHAPVQELAAVGVLDPAALPGHDERGRVGRELVVALAVRVAAGGNGAMRPPAQRRLHGVEHPGEASIRRR